MNRRKNTPQLSGSFLFSSGHQQNNQKSHFRATQLWHKTLHIFTSDITLSSNRSRSRFWRSYDESFVGTPTIDWFTSALQETIDPDITREQGKKLLSKFLKVGVFKAVEGEESVDIRERGVYRLTIPREKEDKSLKGRKKTREEVCYDVFVEQLTSLHHHNLSSNNNPQHIHQNIFSTKKEEDEPTWLPPALKYLTNYPHDSAIKAGYPDFEHDVLLLIHDYFKSFKERKGVLVPDFVAEFLLKEKVLNKYEEAYPFPLTDLEVEEIFTPKKEKKKKVEEREDDIPAMPLLKTNYNQELYYCTSFFTPKTPITRVYSQSTLGNQYAYDNPSLNLSPADLINHPKYDLLRGRLLFFNNKSKSVGDLAAAAESRFSVEDFTLEDEEKKIVALLLLDMEPCKRRHLEVLVRFCGGVGLNERLRLDVAVGNNGEVMLDLFGDVLFGTMQRKRRLFHLLLKNVDFFFSCEEGGFLSFLKIKVEKVEEGDDDEKENRKKSPSLNNSLFCSKITLDEYEDQRLLGETAKSLRSLLDSLCELDDDEGEGGKGKKRGFKRRQLRKFQKEYPHIYNEKFNTTFEEEKKKKKKTTFLPTSTQSVDVGRKVSLPTSTQSVDVGRKVGGRTPFGVLV